MHFRHLILLSLLSFLLSSFAEGQYFEFVHDDSVRSYIVYEPDLDPDPTGYLLVVGLHGTGAHADLYFNKTSKVVWLE